MLSDQVGYQRKNATLDEEDYNRVINQPATLRRAPRARREGKK